jgi:NAD+ synthase
MDQDQHALEINIDIIRSILVEFIHTHITQAGFQHAIVGVSGGVDSALSCFLAAEALAPQNVLAVRMPYRTSAPESFEHAGLVIDTTGVQETTIPITGMVDALLERFPEADRVRRGNIMARARMIVLYDQSAAFEGLVVGTGNKTESLLGYSTLYGDSACAINPLGDLYKTQVRQLASAVGVPDIIIAKPPSADLWVGQTDEEELGLTYEEVDRLLVRLVEGQYSIQDCVETGFDRAFVERVVDQIRRSEFKRTMPPIAKISDKTVGIDPLNL